MPVSTECAAALLSFRYPSNNNNNDCSGATAGSEQQHNQDLREICISKSIGLAYILYILGNLKDSNAAAHSVDTGIS